MKNKPGPKPMPRELKRAVYLAIRVTPGELVIMHERASTAGDTLSNYVRSRVGLEITRKGE